MKIFPSGLPATDKRFYCRLEWKPQDLWVGAFWRRCGNCIDLWVCLLPCLPIHFCWYWHDPAQ
jgi:hypothetical protein